MNQASRYWQSHDQEFLWPIYAPSFCFYVGSFYRLRVSFVFSPMVNVLRVGLD